MKSSPMLCFCFPFAGGTLYSYQSFTKAAPSSVKFLPLELPGRGRRSDEPLLTEVSSMVKDLTLQVEEKLRLYGEETPYIVFGHSMGAILALLVLRVRMIKRTSLPLHLFVSGKAAPSVPPLKRDRYSLPRREFFQMVKQFGGVPDELLEDEAFLEYIEQVLRADIQALDTYYYSPGDPLPVPITAFRGEAEGISDEEFLAWKAETTKEFSTYSFSGGHFFLFHHRQALINCMLSSIQETGLLHG